MHLTLHSTLNTPPITPNKNTNTQKHFPFVTHLMLYTKPLQTLDNSQPHKTPKPSLHLTLCNTHSNHKHNTPHKTPPLHPSLNTQHSPLNKHFKQKLSTLTPHLTPYTFHSNHTPGCGWVPHPEKLGIQLSTMSWLLGMRLSTMSWLLGMQLGTIS